MTAIGIVHPGEMGAAVGGVLAGAGHEVSWASAGRSAQTAARAQAAGLSDAGTVDALARRCEVIVSLCPPHAALETAAAVAGFAGVYVDANAISPRSAAEVAAIVGRGGATSVDGGVIGLPPRSAGTTRLYLSGDGAAAIAALFDGTALDARVVAGGGATAASALKMHYAAWTKGAIALLLAIRAGAQAAGIEDALLAEWELSQPGAETRSRGGARSAAAKGWRWAAEMEEIAGTLAALGLPDGFHRAAAEVYARLPRETDPDDDALQRVIAALLA
jgi:3-hydroxyisobutyrate dehydrogenase-like beta-hydroxyacid dehydrogenase